MFAVIFSRYDVVEVFFTVLGMVYAGSCGIGPESHPQRFFLERAEPFPHSTEVLPPCRSRSHLPV